MMKKPTTEELNFFVEIMTKNNFKAIKIYDMLRNACGENVCTLRNVQRLVQEYRQGKRVGNERLGGSGRPITMSTEENIEIIKTLIEDDCRLSLRGIEAITGINYKTCERILIEQLHKRCVHSKWVPHSLTEAQKESRIAGAKEILEKINGSVYVIDEKWLYAEPLPPKQNDTAWISKGEKRPTTPRRISTDNKFLIIVAINFRGDYKFQVLPRGTYINSDLYVEFLDDLTKAKRTNRLIIMHDNARPHVSKLTSTFINENQIYRIPQPPYSPDMNLLDRFIFRNMEANRFKLSFSSIEESKSFVKDFLSKVRRTSLTNELLRLREDLYKIINNKGCYL